MSAMQAAGVANPASRRKTVNGIYVEPGRLVLRFLHAGKPLQVQVPLTAAEMRAVARCLLEAAECLPEAGPPARVVDLRRQAPVVAEN